LAKVVGYESVGRDLADGTDFWLGVLIILQSIGARLEKGRSVICVNLWTFEKESANYEDLRGVGKDCRI
jgi:hypothetical protein